MTAAPLPGSGDVARAISDVGHITDLGFRQGVVVSWDESTGTNAVNVNGVILNNLPSLNLGEFVILQPGDVVGLLRAGTTYFILGRLTLPAGPDRNRASMGATQAENAAVGFTIPSNYADITVGSATLPSWADMAMVVALGAATWTNSDTVDRPVWMTLEIRWSGGSVTSGDLIQSTVPGTSAALTHSRSFTITNPGTQISVALRLRSVPSSLPPKPGDEAFNLASVSSAIVYWRVD